MTENELSYKIRGAIYKVYNELGPGLLESIYEEALCYQLKKINIEVKTQVPIDITYDGHKLHSSLRLDMLVENKIIIELKSVENLTKLHHKQLLTYLKLSNLTLGILVNFNTENINYGIIRIVNQLNE